MTKLLTIFVDSDAFVALIKKDDTNHKKAKQIFEKLQHKSVTFATSNYVFSEVITVLSQRVNHQTAIAFITNMQSEDSLFIIYRITEELEVKATEIFRDQTSKNVSFVDCANMAVIKEKQINGIFSFDGVYEKNGIKLIENMLPN